VDSLLQWILVAIVVCAVLYLALLVVLVASGRRSDARQVAAFIPVAGRLDDAILVALVLRRVLRQERDLLAEHWPGSPAGLQLLYRLGGSR
jgi:hypothetical protein